MRPARRTGGLQKKLFFALLIVGIVPGIAALWATYAFSTISLKQAIGEGFQEIARSTAIRLAAAVDNEIDRATRLALVPLHVRQPVLLANERAQRKSDGGYSSSTTERTATRPTRAFVHRGDRPVSRRMGTRVQPLCACHPGRSAGTGRRLHGPAATATTGRPRVVARSDARGSRLLLSQQPGT